MLLSLRGLRVLVSVGFADDRRFVRNVTQTSACCALPSLRLTLKSDNQARPAPQLCGVAINHALGFSDSLRIVGAKSGSNPIMCPSIPGLRKL